MNFCRFLRLISVIVTLTLKRQFFTLITVIGFVVRDMTLPQRTDRRQTDTDHSLRTETARRNALCSHQACSYQSTCNLIWAVNTICATPSEAAASTTYC